MKMQTLKYHNSRPGQYDQYRADRAVQNLFGELATFALYLCFAVVCVAQAILSIRSGIKFPLFCGASVTGLLMVAHQWRQVRRLVAVPFRIKWGARHLCLNGTRGWLFHVWQNRSIARIRLLGFNIIVIPNPAAETQSVFIRVHPWLKIRGR